MVVIWVFKNVYIFGAIYDKIIPVNLVKTDQ
jgi:hypothetical protein